MIDAVNRMDDDLFAPAEPSAPAAAEGFVLGDLAGLSIAIPRADVLTIEHGGELSAALPGEPEVGWFSSAHGPWPVYALDADMRPIASRVSGSFLMFLRAQPFPVGLLCERVRILRARSELTVQSLPAVMKDDSGVICGLARIDTARLVWVLREGQLAMHLAHWSERGVRHE
jgi:hypothetical protein